MSSIDCSLPANALINLAMFANKGSIQTRKSAFLKDKRVSPELLWLLDDAEFSAACLHIVFGTHMEALGG